MPFSELFSFMSLVVLFALSPGPNMMLYLTYTFEYGRKAGWATAAGVVSSFIFHVSAVAFGLTALLLAHPQVLDIIRYCGIAYLFFLAYKNLKTIQWKEAGERKAVVNLRRFYTDGFIGNLLNPGSLMLYFSILPQFVHPERGSVLKQNLVLGGLQMLPADPYEAAEIDGARAWQQFLHITLPLLRPAILVALLFRMVFVIRLFDEVWALTRGGPQGATETISVLIYRAAFEQFRMGHAAALSVLLLMLTTGLAVVLIQLLYRRADA